MLCVHLPFGSGICGPLELKAARAGFVSPVCFFSDSLPPFWGADGKSEDSGMTGILKCKFSLLGVILELFLI